MKGIDTFDIAKKAKSAGFNQKQTEFFVETVNTIEDTHVSNLATKDYLANFEEKLTGKIDNLETKLNAKIAGLEAKLTIRIGVMIGIAIAIVTWLDKVIV